MRALARLQLTAASIQPLALALLMTSGVCRANAQCITLDCPTNLVVECENAAGAWVDFTIMATGLCSTNLTLTCDPMPQTVFPPGTNLVTCQAYDDLGNTNVCLFNVLVVDSTPPQVLAPDLIVTPCESGSGATVTFQVIGVDVCDTNVLVSCVPASGSLFAIGTNTVSCTVTDAAGNMAFDSFEVVVTDACSQNPCITVLPQMDILTNVTITGGAFVSFSLQATNVCGPNPIVTCDPPSGSLFPLGITTVVCEATDPAAGGTAFATFTVEVIDETAPTLTCPSNLVAAAQCLDGALVEWTVTATDNYSSNVAVYCDPPSGSAFPIGTSQVICWARDESGNVDTCGFTILVTNTYPFRIDRAAGQNVLLTWQGNGRPQESDTLMPPIPWLDVPNTIITNGSELSMILSASGTNRFFRLSADPLAQPADTDGDGVPDSIDKCPLTPAGTVVDICGCSLLEIVREPERVNADTVRQLGRALREIEAIPTFQSVAEGLGQHQRNMAQTETLIRTGQITNGANLYTQAVAGIEFELQNLRAIVQALDPLQIVPVNADDTTADQGLFEAYFIMDAMLSEALTSATNASDSFQGLRDSITGQTLLSGEVAALDDAAGTLQLVTGQTIGLLETNYADAIAEGASYDFSVLTLGDGTAIAQALQRGLGAPPPTFDAIPVKCLSLRIAPVQPFPPFSFGPFLLHSPAAYEFDDELWLERGMRFAVDGNCPAVSMTSSNTSVSYRMRLDLRYFRTNQNVSTTVMLAGGLTRGVTPVRMPADLDSTRSAKLSATLLRLECEPFGGGLTLCSKGEVVCVQDYTLKIRELNTYATAGYSETEFDMKDAPKFFTTEFRTVQADSIQTDQVFGFSQLDFAAAGYRVQNNQSSYPTVKSVGFNQDFAVHFFDFYNLIEEITDDSFPQWGTATRSALAWPRLTGKRNGRSFSYTCKVPKLVRDTVAFCGPPHGYYRLPFIGGWPTWTMGQGNNGNFTHNSNSAFAFDMRAAQGTAIHAARGGMVVGLTENVPSNFNCFPGCNSAACGSSPWANFIVIQHQDGTFARYVHMPENGVFVVQNGLVHRGDQIGIVGNTGCSSTAHLHFEARSTMSGPSIPSSFEAFEVCNVFGETNACITTTNCYVPVTGDILFSTNKRWSQ